MTKLRYSGQTNKYPKHTVKQLKEIATKLGIKNLSKLTRTQLIDAIESVMM